jgi:hypothetical protein
MPPNEKFWREMEERFSADRADELRADYTYYRSLGEDWRLCAGFSNLVRDRFIVEATRAGDELGEPTTERDSLYRWLNLLREKKPNWVEPGPIGGFAENADGSKEPILMGTIHRVIEKSALMCRILQGEARSYRPSDPGASAGSTTEEHKTDKVSSAGTPRQARRQPRRHPRNNKIDDGLRAIAEMRPKNHHEVFLSLDDRRIPVADAEPFRSARGWVTGFQRNAVLARTWLSKTWSLLGLPRFKPGPK